MAHIDDVAAIAAVRHARQSVVTASTDSVDFLQPVKVGDSISIEGFVTYVHNTSMEVFIKVIKRTFNSRKVRLCNGISNFCSVWGRWKANSCTSSVSRIRTREDVV